MGINKLIWIFFFYTFSGSRGAVRYSIYSGDPDGYFSIDPMSGNIRIASPLDHETKVQVLLNIQATSGDPPAYGHTQVSLILFSVCFGRNLVAFFTVRLNFIKSFEWTCNSRSLCFFAPALKGQHRHRRRERQSARI